jgi:4-hydroxybenzoate polyprenyltransferase
MSRAEAVAFVAISSGLFVLASSRLGALCLALSPVALAIVFWYSLTKRFTAHAQLFLGLAMAVAPVGGWLAAGGRSGSEPWLLGLAIGTWVGGFDVLYACQDLDVDRREGLRSIPVRFGVPRALAISRAMPSATGTCWPVATTSLARPTS